MESFTGLTKNEVDLRKQRGQQNICQKKVGKSSLRIVFDNWFTLFNAFNALIALSLALVGAWLNMAFLAIIILNATIGTVQELRAKKLVQNLALVSASQVTVLREGIKQTIPPQDLVLDDIILLSAGEQIPADGIILEGYIEANQSLLTGESQPVPKKNGEEILSGSFISGGRCFAKVIRVGENCFAARLAREGKKHKKPSSDLVRSMAKVTFFTSFFIIPVGILLFCEAYFLRNDALSSSVVSSSAALLGMLPKGLVLITTIALFSGVIKLSGKKVLVQQLHSLETLAKVDVLCLDKTGTLTEGVMQVADVLYLQNSPHPPSSLIQYFAAASQDDNATMQAIRKHFPSASAPKVTAQIPFSSERKWSALTLEGIGSVILGASEALSADIPSAALNMQREGKRLLCFAYSPSTLSDGLPSDLAVFAFLALHDPVRKTAPDTLKYFAQEGVSVKVISGDNPLTASLVAQEAGLLGFDNFVDMSNLSCTVAEAAVKYTVFGRTTPQQKKEIIAALKAAGHTVAMTGDGVNDLPALRESDCGISFASGSPAAKQVSELVLADDDFSALPDIVLEGRRVMNNITRVAGVFFVKTIYSVLLSLFCIVLNMPFPFIPLQITLIDAAIEAYPAFFLSFAPDKNRIQKDFLSLTTSRAAPYAIFITLSAIGLLFAARLQALSQAEAVTLSYFVTGFVTVIALFRSCTPLSGFRMFFCVTAAAGFFGAALIFSKLLSLAPLSLPLFIILAAIVGTAVLATLLKKSK